MATSYTLPTPTTHDKLMSMSTIQINSHGCKENLRSFNETDILLKTQKF